MVRLNNLFVKGTQNERYPKNYFFYSKFYCYFTYCTGRLYVEFYSSALAVLSVGQEPDIPARKIGETGQQTITLSMAHCERKLIRKQSPAL